MVWQCVWVCGGVGWWHSGIGIHGCVRCILMLWLLLVRRWCVRVAGMGALGWLCVLWRLLHSVVLLHVCLWVGIVGHGWLRIRRCALIGTVLHFLVHARVGIGWNALHLCRCWLGCLCCCCLRHCLILMLCNLRWVGLLLKHSGVWDSSVVGRLMMARICWLGCTGVGLRVLCVRWVVGVRRCLGIALRHATCICA